MSRAHSPWVSLSTLAVSSPLEAQPPPPAAWDRATASSSSPRAALNPEHPIDLLMKGAHKHMLVSSVK